MSAILHCRPLDLMTTPDRVIPPETIKRFHDGIMRLAAGEPLQYVTGFEYFMEHRFRTDPRALIPRPETETLVLTALAERDLWRRKPAPVILDLGTGSGCLTVTLALEHPTAVHLAADNSVAALALAQENAAAHQVDHRIRFFESDLLSAVGNHGLDALITNPPYIATADYLRLPRYIREHEPRAALDGGLDGLAVIDAIICEAARCLRPHGWIFIEIGHGQGQAVQQRLRNASFVNPNLVHDIAGRERVVRARRGNG